MATDTEYQNLLATQATVGQIINHPKTQTVVGSQEILQQLEQVDLKDLLAYLQSGQSPQYQDLPILGRWQLEPYSTLAQVKKRRVRITSVEMRLLRQQMEFIKGYQLVVLPDNTAKLKGPDVTQLLKKYLGEAAKALSEGGSRAPAPVARAVPAPARPPPQSPSSRLMEQRYGRSSTPTPVPAAPTVTVAPTATPAPPSPAAIAAEIATLPIVVLAQGSWKGGGDHYEFDMRAQVEAFKFDESKKSAAVEASIRDGKLYLTEGKETMVLVKF